MDNLLSNKEFREELSDLIRIDITSIICFFIFAVICSFIFLSIIFEKYIKYSTLKVSILQSLTEIQQRQGLQLAG